MKKVFLHAIKKLNSIVDFRQKSIKNELTSAHREVNGTKISLIPPDGFTRASNFSGFQQIESGSSIMVLNIPEAFLSISKGLNNQALLSKGMVLKKIKKLTLNNLPAILLKAEQNANSNIYIKYMLAFGTQKESILINGVFPKNIKGLDKLLKKSLLSTVYNSNKKINPFDTADFEISTEGTDIVFAKSVSNSLMFSRDGKIPSESKDNLLLIIGKAFSKIDIEDKKLFAINRIKQLPIEIKEIISTEPIEIDNIKGYEVIADGCNFKTEEKVKAYQVILFSDSLYYMMYGSSESDFDNNIEVFKKVVKTFRRK